MLKWIFLLTSVFFLFSCTSLEAQWKKRTYSPKGGVIYYNPQPDLFNPGAVSKRKSNAKMKMDEFCQPYEAKIISEQLGEEVIGQHGHYSDFGTVNLYNIVRNRVYLTFKCQESAESEAEREKP